MAARLAVQILGPLRVWRDGIEVDPGPPQQARLLAVLSAQIGRPVSTSELISLVWEDQCPSSATNIIHKYVGRLRRVLEPELPGRASGSYLKRRGLGYQLDLGEVADIERFRALVRSAATHLVEERPQAALESLVAALTLWQGSAGEGMARGPTAMALFVGLDGEFFQACVTAARVAVAHGGAARVVPRLRMAASMAPLHEHVQAALVLALGAAGQQAEALEVYRTVRARLQEELGADPGSELEAAQRSVLRATTWRPSVASSAAAHGAQMTLRPTPADRLVGRVDELKLLSEMFEACYHGHSSLVLVEGEPGVGKTRLMEEVARAADRRGAASVWCRWLGDGATPPLWPWIQAARVLAGDHQFISPAGPKPDGAWFGHLETVTSALAHAAASGPVLLVADDLHRADEGSIDLLRNLLASLPRGVMVLGAFRDRAPQPSGGLVRLLASVVPLAGHRRLRLAPLGPDAVAVLVRCATGEGVAPDVADTIHARTGGNPLLVRELTRLGSTERAVTEVPVTLLDIVRDRTAGLDAASLLLLRLMSLMGERVDLDALLLAANLDPDECFDRLEQLHSLALVDADDTSSVRVVNGLVRASVVACIPPGQTARLHRRLTGLTPPAAATSVTTGVVVPLLVQSAPAVTDRHMSSQASELARTT